MASAKYCVGDFDQYVSIETPTEVRHGSGFDTSWANSKGFVWCKVEEKSGGETQFHDQLNTTTSVLFTMNYRDDIDTKDRLVLDGVLYNIRRVDNLNRKNRYLQVTAESGVRN